MVEKQPHKNWGLCDAFTVIQAALLIAGHEPAEHDDVESLPGKERPDGYEAAKSALVEAIYARTLSATVAHGSDRVDARSRKGYRDLSDGQGKLVYVVREDLDPSVTTISAKDLRQWLEAKGIRSGFFFPSVPPYRDRTHPCFAPKLGAAVQAWEAVALHPRQKSTSPKQAITKWLNDHAHELGLLREDGAVNNDAVDQIAKVTNWNLTGGAPKSGR